jgi:GAF domain-containing protein
VSGERRLRVLSLLNRVSDGEEPAARLCDVCAEVAQMSGAGIMLMSGSLPRGSVCTTNEISARIEELQYDLGEGPCMDAFLEDRPVLEPDLAHPSVPRWVAFTEAALAAGVRAVFGFPLRVGAVRLGALNLFRDAPGPLTDEQHADALVLADVAAQSVLVLQAGAPPGQLAVQLDTTSDFHLVVHQAAGMVAAQLDVDVGVALIRLRSYAFGNGRSLTDVSRDVVARTLRLVDLPAGEDDGQ